MYKFSFVMEYLSFSIYNWEFLLEDFTFDEYEVSLLVFFDIFGFCIFFDCCVQPNDPKKKAGVAILISNKINFKPTVIIKGIKGHFILIKGKIYQKEFSIPNIYAPNARRHIFIKEALLKLKSTHCTSHNTSGRIQHPTLINGQILEKETEQRHNESKRNYEIKGFNKYL